tara:strand:- start:328 stop:1134 length:807 start_codon:yes stop_codon:yes gene_type:complete
LIIQGKGNLAADKWRDEVLELKSEISTKLATVTEDRKNFSSFLSGVNDELRRLLENTVKCQDYMAQYGYKPKVIDTEALLDWSPKQPETEEDPEEVEQICDVAPPAASEFEEDSIKTEPIKEQDDPMPASAMKKTPHRLQESSKKPLSSSQDSPNIFDIGLSKYGMSLLLGKDISKPTPSLTSASPLVSSSSSTSHFTDSPEMPEFTSNIMKTLMAAKAQEKSSLKEPVTKSRPTPEFPQDLSFLKKEGGIQAQSNTPESPILNFKYK